MIMRRRIITNGHKKYRISTRVERLLHKRMKAILATSLRVSNELLEKDVPSNQLEVIYNGVEVEKFTILYDKKLN